MPEIMDVRDLRTYFFTSKGTVKAVDGVSFKVGEKEAVGIVGESGCGKSTVAFSIMRLIPSPPGRIVAGEVLLKDRDLLRLTDDKMRQISGKEVSMIFQDPMTFLNPLMKVGRQIVEVISLHQGLDLQASKKKAIELLKLVKMPLPEVVYESYPHQISGGMKQRSLIAMSLAGNPALLIADEPTTALDTTIQVQILNLIDELKSSLGMSLLLVSHDLGIVAEICDRVNVMYAAKIVEHGNIVEVYENPLHPYTRGLIDSVLTLETKMEKVPTIEGVVPSLVSPPPGCRFHPRCKHAMQKCKTKEPMFFQHGSDHAVACWLYGAP